jgi:hypothetical protein
MPKVELCMTGPYSSLKCLFDSVFGIPVVVCVSGTIHLSIYLPIYLSIHLSMALQPFVGPWPLFQFLDLLHSRWDSGRVIGPSQGRYLHTEQHKHRINAYTDDHTSSGIRNSDPSFWAGEDSSCFIQCCHCDRRMGGTETNLVGKFSSAFLRWCDIPIEKCTASPFTSCA